MTLGAESFWSGSYMTTIIQNFTLVSLISTMTPYPVEFLLGATISSLLTHSTFYVLDSLYTCLPMYSSFQHYVFILVKKIFRLSIYLRSSTCQGMQFVIFNCRSIWQKNWATGWTQSTLLLYVVVSLVISIGQSNWLDDKWSPLVYHQVNQSNWFHDKGSSSVCYWVFKETGLMTKVWRIFTFSMSLG